MNVLGRVCPFQGLGGSVTAVRLALQGGAVQDALHGLCRPGRRIRRLSGDPAAAPW